MFSACGVPQEKFRTICSAVDKLDKVSHSCISPLAFQLFTFSFFHKMEWEEVRKEMVEEKGLDGDVADKIGHYVKLRGGMDLVSELALDQSLMAVKDAETGIAEMKTLLRYCELFGVSDKVRDNNIIYRPSFGMSLRKNLNYKTLLHYTNLRPPFITQTLTTRPSFITQTLTTRPLLHYTNLDYKPPLLLHHLILIVGVL